MHDGLEHVADSLATRGGIGTLPDTRYATHHPRKRIRINHFDCLEYGCYDGIDLGDDFGRSQGLVSESVKVCLWPIWPSYGVHDRVI
jgi:hypothetical protein